MDAVKQMFETPLYIGSNPGAETSFSGSLSCFQLFDEALDQATIYHKRKCLEVESSLSREKPCPDGWYFYDGSCYLISLSKDSFSKAESKCLPHIDSDYNSQLLWTENPKVLHHLATLVKTKTGSTSFFVGISDQDEDGFYETRYDNLSRKLS